MIMFTIILILVILVLVLQIGSLIIVKFSAEQINNGINATTLLILTVAFGLIIRNLFS